MNRLPRIVSVLKSSAPSRLVVRRFSSLGCTLSKAHLNSFIGPSCKSTRCPRYVLCLERDYSSKTSKSQSGGEEGANSIMESFDQPQTQLTVAAKVVQAGKDVSYFGVILIGFAITGALLWVVVSELFFGFSPNKVYSDALKKIKANYEVAELIGKPIMGYGETTSRGRRRHVSYQEYIVNGEEYMRVKFYISGPRGKANVHVDVKQGSHGSYDYRFILVEPEVSSRTIIVLDNR